MGDGAGSSVGKVLASQARPMQTMARWRVLESQDWAGRERRVPGAHWPVILA